VKTNPAPSAPAAAPVAPTGLRRRWVEFWFTPIAPTGLHWVRFLSGLLFLAWLLPLTGQRAAFFGLDGWFDRQAYIEASQLPEGTMPYPLGWSLLYPFSTSDTALTLFWFGALTLLVLFTLGVATRLTGILTWIIVVSFLANPAIHYDADFLLAILAFYLMLGYLFLGQWNRDLTLVERILGPRGTSVFALLRRPADVAPPSYAANLALRLLQIHFAVIVVVSALHKLQFGDWWSGVAYWYPLHPPFETDAARIRAERPSADVTLFVLSAAQYLALAWQLTFPLFAFRKRWRAVLLGGAAVAWLGMIFIYRQPLFGPFYCIACLSYLTPVEWAWISTWLASLVRRDHAATSAPDSRVRLKTNA